MESPASSSEPPCALREVGRVSLLLLSLLAAAQLADDSSAVSRLFLEVRGGVAVGGVTASGAGFENEPGPAFFAGASYDLTQSVSVHAGYARAVFGCAHGFCTSNETSFTSSGVELGARLVWNRIWAQGAVLRRATSAEWGSGRRGDAESSFGWELGAGFGLPLGSRFRMTPGVRYGAYRARFEGGEQDDAVGYFAIDLGLGAGVWAGP